MDDARIDAIRREVMGQLAPTPGERAAHDIETRVAALEEAVAALRGGARPPAASVVRAPDAPAGHASLRVLGPGGGTGGSCLMEPDKPCVQSHACRTFGH